VTDPFIKAATQLHITKPHDKYNSYEFHISTYIPTPFNILYATEWKFHIDSGPFMWTPWPRGANGKFFLL